MAQQQDPTQKLAALLAPLLNDVKKELKEHQVIQSQEVLIAINRLETKIDLMEKLLADKRKPVARAEKKVDGTDAGAPVPTAAGEKKSFATNKLIYFREQFKTNPEYRAKYFTPEIQALCAADAVVASKVKEDQKLLAQASFTWNFIKLNNPTTGEAIEKEYQAAKQAHEAANKPAQQSVEAHTPQ